MLSWPRGRWIAAAFASLGTALALGVPTGLIPNPFIDLDGPTAWWSHLGLAAISVLSGVLVSTYLVPVDGASGRDVRRRAGVTTAGGLYVTICPTCTLIAGLALGTGSVVTWLQPAQPLLALGAVALLALALYRRVRSEGRCRIVAAQGNTTT